MVPLDVRVAFSAIGLDGFPEWLRDPETSEWAEVSDPPARGDLICGRTATPVRMMKYGSVLVGQCHFCSTIFWCVVPEVNEIHWCPDEMRPWLEKLERTLRLECQSGYRMVQNPGQDGHIVYVQPGGVRSKFAVCYPEEITGEMIFARVCAAVANDSIEEFGLPAKLDALTHPGDIEDRDRLCAEAVRVFPETPARAILNPEPAANPETWRDRPPLL